MVLGVPAAADHLTPTGCRLSYPQEASALIAAALSIGRIGMRIDVLGKAAGASWQLSSDRGRKPTPTHPRRTTRGESRFVRGRLNRSKVLGGTSGPFRAPGFSLPRRGASSNTRLLKSSQVKIYPGVHRAVRDRAILPGKGRGFKNLIAFLTKRHVITMEDKTGLDYSGSTQTEANDDGR